MNNFRYAVALLIIGLVLLGVTTLIASRAAVSGFEKSVFEGIFELSDSLEPIFMGVTLVGMFGLLFLNIGYAWRAKEWFRAIWVIPAALGGYAMTAILKSIIERPRPEQLLGIIPREKSDVIAHDGFPSGHVTIAATLTILLMYQLPRKWRPVLWVVPIFIGFGRIYFGEHMPLDIVGGIAMGMVVATILELSSRLWRRPE